jgi:predicted AAA+ superfamily ATPase
MSNNNLQIQDGFRFLLFALSKYICVELKRDFGDNWWKEGVMGALADVRKRDLLLCGDWSELVDSLDILQCLLLFDYHWQSVFSKKLSVDHREWAKELVGITNKLENIGAKDFSDDETRRALDTMSRLSDQINFESAEVIRKLMRVNRDCSIEGLNDMLEAPNSSSVTQVSRKDSFLQSVPINGLSSWRDVIEPHPDVAQGRYKNAEFAANIAQVSKGEGAYEYLDPVEFFARTFVTEGMTGLLEQALRRVCGKDGEPVIQLKTAFGGGKTHSMLALYHLMGGRVTIDKIPNALPVLERVGLTVLPKANVAVLVGSALDPSKAKPANNIPGATINTLWGEMAAQLAESSGNFALFELVKESDKYGVSPGSDALRTLFDSAAPCLVLMDELVVYAKKIHGISGLPAGSFDNFISFIQEVTEAASSSKNSLVVASIPESELEIGGEAGKIALETIEHTFGRMESIWKPVTANEGFEVVRRRLFLECKNPNARDEVCNKFSQMYFENQSLFPLETREVDYRKRLISSYPIHPEIFDRLYEDWATLERFQRTRGVLRLMAGVIHELWMGNDASLMIMPGSVPLDAPNVRDELTRHLSEGWNALVDREVDGKNSIPYKTDQLIPRYGNRLAARRVARTVMLGSAPTVREQKVRGIDASHIRLGVVQPGENIACFNDALNTLSESLSYFYSNQSTDRFFYDTRPTLRKIVEDRATQTSESDTIYEIERRLRLFHRERPFAGIHICPTSSNDVLDEQNARLVILRPVDGYKANILNDNAIIKMTNILNNRGNLPRIYRNSLAFVAPDDALAVSMQQAARFYLAWKSIKDNSEDLNLDAAQNRQVKQNYELADRTVDARIRETYCCLFFPNIDIKTDIKALVWESFNISGGDENIIQKVCKKALTSENVIERWSPILLRKELDNILWLDKDRISIKKLWADLCAYCYLPRLANEKVLFEAIKEGVNSSEYFAIASGFDGSRYIDLKFNQVINFVDNAGYLVKVDIAQKQLASEASNRQERPTVSRGGAIDLPTGEPGETAPSTHYAPTEIGDGRDDSIFVFGDTSPVKPISKIRRFVMSADIDFNKMNKMVRDISDEIIVPLTEDNGVKVKLTLEIVVEKNEGFTQKDIRTVSENSKTLKVNISWDEE